MTACTPKEPENVKKQFVTQDSFDSNSTVAEFTYKVSDGRTVHCLRYKETSYKGFIGSISCDWKEAKLE